MTTQPKVSVIVPIYNVECFLPDCLDSLAGQTLSDIEIICVDDGSTDRCPDILAEYAKRDTRIRILTQEVNKGLFQARKDGVAISNGKYIMFLDSDDAFLANTCEEAFRAIEENQVDILQFGTKVMNPAGLPDDKIRAAIQYMKPCLEAVAGETMIHDCFIKRAFNHNMWNKIYAAELCKRAYAELPDAYIIHAEDVYAFFVIANYASSYIGIEKELYCYNYGIGATGSDHYTLEQFTRLLKEREVHTLLTEYVKQHNLQEQYADVLDNIYRRFLNNCVAIWHDNLDPQDFHSGFDKLVQTWGFEDTIAMVEERSKNAKCTELNRKLQITYKEKSARGEEIKKLKKELEDLRKETDNLRSSITFKVGKFIMFIPHYIKNKFK